MCRSPVPCWSGDAAERGRDERGGGGDRAGLASVTPPELVLPCSAPHRSCSPGNIWVYFCQSQPSWWERCVPAPPDLRLFPEPKSFGVSPNPPGPGRHGQGCDGAGASRALGCGITC